MEVVFIYADGTSSLRQVPDELPVKVMVARLEVDTEGLREALRGERRLARVPARRRHLAFRLHRDCEGRPVYIQEPAA